MPPKRVLNEALDPFSGFVDEGAEIYEKYLKELFRMNRIRNRVYWDPHYQRIDQGRERSIEAAVRICGVAREKMNMLFVGLGREPAGGYDPFAQEFLIGEISAASAEQMKVVPSVVVADISQQVASDGVKNLVEVGGMNPDSLFPAQFDITKGRAAIYAMQLRKWADRVKNLAHLQNLAEKLRKYPVSRLDEKLVEARRDWSRRTAGSHPRPPIIPGGINQDRLMRYSVHEHGSSKNEPLPIHFGMFSMVNAGIGSPYEWEFLWKLLDEYTGKPEHLRDPSLLAIRNEIRIIFHDWISRFNTYVAIESVRSFFIANLYSNCPEPVLYLVSDYCTRYKRMEGGQPIGQHPRLNYEQVRKELAGIEGDVEEGMPLIETTVEDLGTWDDEVDDPQYPHPQGLTHPNPHGHGVIGMFMRIKHNGRHVRHDIRTFVPPNVITKDPPKEQGLTRESPTEAV